MSLEGQHIGRYALLHLLGSGGMGEVYLATDTPINRQVAIKVMRSDATPYPDADSTHNAARLFQREVRAIAGLDHPHILPLYDYGEDLVRDAKITYMVMPYRPDGTLVTWLHQRGNAGLLSPLDVAQIILQAASALQYAHDRQIIHQDVKPSNFLIRSDEHNPHLPYLLLSDFGVAKLSTMTSNTSQSVRGTPTYMAPEQWEGRAVPATDQYSLAVMAYELLAGRPPFQGGLTQMMYQHMNVQPQPPSAYNPHIPHEIDEVILCALAKKPESRFLAISAFAKAFSQAVQSIDEPTLLQMQNNMQSSTILSTPLPGSSSDSIYATLAISADEALYGTTRTLSLPGGQHLPVTIPSGIRDGQIIRLDSQGKVLGEANQTGAVVLTIVVKPGEKPAMAPLSNPYDMTVASTPANSLQNSQTVYSSPHGPINQPPLIQSGAPANQQPPIISTGAVTGQPRRLPISTTLLLIGLVLLVIVGGGIYFARANLGGGGKNNPVLVVTVPSSSHTPLSTTAPTTALTPTATTSTNTSSPTATTSTNTSNPYTQSGTLVLNDSLVDNSQGHAWLEGTNKLGATCQFTQGAYQATQPNAGYFHACIAQATDYSNFVFEVQVTLLSGDYVGLVFRTNSDPANSSSYQFGIDTSGHFYLKLYDSGHSTGLVLGQGSTTPIALGQSYLFAVVADYSNIGLYLNQQKIDNVTDGSVTHGQIGVFVGNVNNSALAQFSHARVWTL
jgi:eukaryotic-like serine/threonine-protein kinase